MFIMTEHDTVWQQQVDAPADFNQGAGNDSPGIRANDDNVIYIGHNPIDNYAMDAVSILGKDGSVTLRSKGRSIPTAVTVANIVTREILKDSSRVRQILLDTDSEPGIGSMTSTIEIRLDRRQ